MNLSEFQKLAVTTAIYPREYAVEYPLLGLFGEAGEIANKVKKRLRDNAQNDEAIIAEVGDAFWYVATTAQDCGIELEDGFLLLPKHLPSLTEAVRHLGGEIGILLQNADNDGLVRHRDYTATSLRKISGYLVAILYHLDVRECRVGDVLQANIDKLLSRKERGTLQGSGDNR
jgi:NTP pyrophosphatase (non-canonical NTP hydrolase)